MHDKHYSGINPYALGFNMMQDIRREQGRIVFVMGPVAVHTGGTTYFAEIVRGEVIPGIEARNIAGFRHIDLMKRELDDEVEFQTLMWFDSLDAIKAFIGDDYDVSHVPAAARTVLSRFDERAVHFEVIDRREQ